MQYDAKKKPYQLAAKAFRRQLGKQNMDTAMYVEIVKQGGLERKEIHDRIEQKVRQGR